MSLPLLLALVWPVEADAQNAGVAGRVVDAGGVPLGDVVVRVSIAGRSTLSGPDGSFGLLGLPPGAAVLTFERIGFTARADTFGLRAGEVLEVEVRLSETAVALDAIVVRTDESSLPTWLIENGFAARRADGRGLLHRTRRELSMQGGRDLAEVLRLVPGVRIRRRSDYGSELLIERGPDTAPCRVSVYLNGSAVDFGRFNWTGVDGQRGTRPLRFDDLLRLDQVDGIELYGPDESPIAAETDCGALILWSAELRPRLDEPFTGEVRGTVVYEDGAVPVRGAHVSIPALARSSRSDEHGSFTFPALPAGRYTIEVRVADAEPWTSTIEVLAFSALDFVFEVGRR